MLIIRCFAKIIHFWLTGWKRIPWPFGVKCLQQLQCSTG